MGAIGGARAAIASLAFGSAIVGATALVVVGAVRAAPRNAAFQARACGGEDTGITLPPGFCATVFADSLGNVRHIAVGPTGVVYANSWSGRYYPGSIPPTDGFLVALQDTTGQGKADKLTRFGETPGEGAAGGTGVAVYRGAVYAEVNDKIVRYPIPPGTSVPTAKPQIVLSGMPLGGDHPMHPFVISGDGALFVDMGTATNSCQPKNRAKGVPGADPCIERETRGGIWRYDANKLGQIFSSKERYATGLRNGEGLSFDAKGRLFATQHGRDQLLQNWPNLYKDPARATELPAEELLYVTKGADFGWPTCYYDGFQKKLVLAPEYGGDGGAAVGVCASKVAPVAAFPAHWAPNDMKIYKANAFPSVYRGGAFIAFHGSWNRAPAPQDGFKVVFQPLRDAQATGPFVVFADGFAGPDKGRGRAVFRPMGLAVAPDGALFISDDVKGRIWRVTYQGPMTAGLAAAPEPGSAQAQAAPSPPVSRRLATPPGSSPGQVEAGMKLFLTSSCSGCHGARTLRERRVGQTSPPERGSGETAAFPR